MEPSMSASQQDGQNKYSIETQTENEQKNTNIGRERGTWEEYRPLPPLLTHEKIHYPDTDSLQKVFGEDFLAEV